MENTVLELLDLEKNGFSSMVRDNIAQNRMGQFCIKLKDENAKPVYGAKVTLEQLDHEFKFGCNAFMADGFETEERNAAYRQYFKDTFNQAVAPFYWSSDEPEEGNWRFTPDAPHIYRRPNPYQILEFCKQVGATPKGHNMLYFQFAPDWLKQKPKQDIASYIRKRFEQLSRFAEDIPVWDVVNEHLPRMLIQEEPDFWERWALDLPKDYEYLAFALAEKYFPYNHLIANEDTERTWDDFHFDSSKFYLYLNNLIARGYKLDGLGVQYHLITPEQELEATRKTKVLNAEHLLTFLDFYSKMNKSIHISEITVPSYGKEAKNEELQAKMVDNLYRIWFSGAQTASIVWWDLVDGYNFMDESHGGGLVRKDMTPKPAMKVIQNLINREWHTHVEQCTDTQGRVTAKAFYGTYRITVEKDGLHTEKIIKLLKNDNAFLTLYV